MIKKPEVFDIKEYDKNKFQQSGILDCYQSVDLSAARLKDIPFNFGTVYGNFDCSFNQLTSLRNSPTVTHGTFNCSYNQLISLDGSPSEIGNGDFRCNNNELILLLGCPKIIQGHFNCSHNNLFSLLGSPTEVGSFLNCSNNNLTSLSDIPKISGKLFCVNNQFNIESWLTILEKFPDSYNQCDIVQDNSSYQSTLESLKMKQKLLNLMIY